MGLDLGSYLVSLGLLRSIPFDSLNGNREPFPDKIATCKCLDFNNFPLMLLHPLQESPSQYPSPPHEWRDYSNCSLLPNDVIVILLNECKYQFFPLIQRKFHLREKLQGHEWELVLEVAHDISGRKVVDPYFARHHFCEHLPQEAHLLGPRFHIIWLNQLCLLRDWRLQCLDWIPI